MSSKKSLRKQRQEQQQQKRGRWNPATVFLLVIAVALIVIVIVGYLARDPSLADPPWPGAVWSPEHGHWH